MLENYQIIKDESILRNFISWLPELKPNEMYYFALFARKKYCQMLKSDKAQLKRFTSYKDLIFSKIKQLECELGSYTQDGVEIPNQALALYISVNPRNLETAAKNSLIRFANLVTKDYSNYNPQSEVLNEIQKAAGTKHFYDLDFDNVDMTTTLNEIEKIIPNDKYYVVRTKNGFHVLLELEKFNEFEKKNWFNVTKIAGCDVRGDNLIPVPGCAQADHMPTLFRNTRIILEDH